MATEQELDMNSAQGISRRELRDLVREQLRVLLDQNNLTGAKALLVPVKAPDIAEAIEGLPETMQALAFRLLPKDDAAEVYEHLESNVQQLLIEDFKRQEVLDIVDKMSPDDRAKLFDELPAKLVRRIVDQLSHAEREATALLLGYEASTAGRIMTPKYISLKEEMTVDDALARIRRLADTTETIYYLYVTDNTRCLTGIVSLRDIVTSHPQQLVSELVTRDVVSVTTDEDQEEVARIIQRYDFLAVPVVDRENRLVGIVTVDDVIDILEEEATKDIYALGGVQAGDDDYFQTNLVTVAQRRVVWLLVLLVTNAVTGAIIRGQDDILKQVVSLASFIPLLIGTGGNVGAQSSTVVIRGLNIDQIRSGPLRVIRREAVAGALLGMMLGTMVCVGAMLFQYPPAVAISVGVSLMAISTLAATAGSVLPFLFQSVGFDPALMSAPFITTAVDMLGVLTYFTVARFMLARFNGG
ncbi:magnesium transporter [Limnothrix redekei]|uniref:Magnesium transporter MgtE n=1 Tax=Limnothrix redekei LRLZ20PSL1 TaxID=3112953 RepID=A0ABW7CD36_9CYAN